MAPGSAEGELPRLRKQGRATQLLVDGRPFLILGGEIGNSAASSREALDAIWPRLVAQRLNTVLVPVYWELCEPDEGRFDFALVDHAIEGARRHGLRVVLLWFGSWKNSMSCYAPLWVKSDQARFPRAQRRDGRGLEILSAFSDENLQADARAFAALMRHVREVDHWERTVVMVQVENEVGMLEEAADRSEVARRAFAQPIPEALRGDGAGTTWAEIFGDGEPADEAFMAFHLARYVGRVAEAGKAEYPLPMFANAALNRPNRRPGEYPSGGPLPHLMEIWRAAAPAVDFLSPDIYFPHIVDLPAWCGHYARPENPLFIPEIVNRPEAAVEALYAIGQHDAIGFSPFSVDTGGPAPADGGPSPLAASYDVLGQLAPLILDSQGRGLLGGVLLDDERQSAELQLGRNTLAVRHDYTWEWASPARASRPWPRAGALAIATGPDEYIVAGSGVIVTFAPAAGDASVAVDPAQQVSAGIASIDEGRFERGRFVPGRRLNGDESHQGRHLRLPTGAFGIQRARLYRYR